MFCPYHEACGVLVPQPGIDLQPLALEAWSPNHCTAREIPEYKFFFKNQESFLRIEL